MEPQQASFDTFGRWQLTRLRANLAPSRDVPPSPLYRFFTDLYEDMLLNPGAYSIPDEPFVTFFALDPLSPEEKARHEALKAARMRVRKAVYGYLEFLFRLGQMGEPAGTDLQLPAQEVATLVADTAKKAKTRHILAALERTGLSFSSGDPMVVSNPHYPGMPAELATFSRACARVKEFGFYLFCRCDSGVFEGKTKPDFADALHLAPEPFRAQVAETDERLLQMRFKREIFVDGGDLTYRVRYSKRRDQVVYWLRIQETFHADLAHYLRWKLDSDLTPRLLRPPGGNRPRTGRCRVHGPETMRPLLRRQLLGQDSGRVGRGIKRSVQRTWLEPHRLHAVRLRLTVDGARDPQ